MWRVSLLFFGACSFAFMPPPSAVTPACDDSYQAPMPDTIIGGALVATAVAVGAFAKPDSNGPETKAAYWLGLVPLALVVSGSAVYGYMSRSRCARVRAAATIARTGAR